MKYLFNLVCLFIVQKTYSSYLWICVETLPRDCDYHILAKKIQSCVKIFKAFLDATRLNPKAIDEDVASEVAKLKEVTDDLYSGYHNKMNVISKQ